MNVSSSENVKKLKIQLKSLLIIPPPTQVPCRPSPSPVASAPIGLVRVSLVHLLCLGR